MKAFSFFLFILTAISWAEHAEERAPAKRQVEERSAAKKTAPDFICVDIGGDKWKPKSGKYPALGWGGYLKADCEKAVKSARNGVICTFTGLGFKPTHFSGRTAMRPDYGYFGTSITGPKALELCMRATSESTDKGVCHYNDDDWIISDVSGSSRRTHTGSYRSLDACLKALNPKD